jgi:hypothetical protein
MYRQWQGSNSLRVRLKGLHRHTPLLLPKVGRLWLHAKRYTAIHITVNRRGVPTPIVVVST